MDGVIYQAISLVPPRLQMQQLSHPRRDTQDSLGSRLHEWQLGERLALPEAFMQYLA